MAATFYLIRHGETEGSETRRYKGSIDVPLSERGIEQMSKTAEFIFNREKRGNGETETSRDSGLSAVYCSPLSRAMKSAEIISEPFGLKPIVIAGLRERNFGSWEGMSFDEIGEKYPDEFKAWADNPLEYSPINGESTIEVRNRVICALNRISDDNYISRVQGFKDSSENTINTLDSSRPRTLETVHIAIVAHGGVNRIILCHLLGVPLKNIFRIEQDFGAINIIEFWDNYPVVKLINGMIR